MEVHTDSSTLTLNLTLTVLKHIHYNQVLKPDPYIYMPATLLWVPYGASGFYSLTRTSSLIETWIETRRLVLASPVKYSLTRTSSLHPGTIVPYASLCNSCNSTCPYL